MRNECVRAVEELALADPKVVVVASDPGCDYMPELARKHPERLMIEGICEQGLAGVAAGMANEGFYPFVMMIAVFATRRCYEQLLLDFGLHELSGCVVGAGAGLFYAPMGPTHLSVDDLMLVQSIPGSAVLTPAEPAEAAELVRQARGFKGLSYMRLGGTTDALVTPRGEITLGKARVLEEPGEVLFISCGASTLVVEQAVAQLKATGIGAGLLHLPAVKPLDVEQVRRCVGKAKAVLCVEEHRQIGGLSSAVLQALHAAEPAVLPEKFVSIGLDDTFPVGHGTYEELMAHYGIGSTLLAERARAALTAARPQGRKLALGV